MKNHTVQFTLSHTEWQALDIVAASKGFGTIGRYAKYLAFERANRRPAKGIMAHVHGVAQTEYVLDAIVQLLNDKGDTPEGQSPEQAFLHGHVKD